MDYATFSVIATLALFAVMVIITVYAIFEAIRIYKDCKQERKELNRTIK